MLLFNNKKKLLHLSAASLILFFALYFDVSAVTGNRGFLTLVKLRKEIDCNKSLLKDLSSEREKLSNRIFGLYEKSLDLDLLDEQVKNILGYISSDELMFILRK
ncbi:MAG: septum formation initiator family protein [Wolbachia endosymbiont of Tyrophagus putrescentiae]|nr:septum formation initiator family protein [Wolbachia endosymbiont of Tyrophagus putrescentiae]MDN5249147.1 septum formation initiator family protein [Alphaproteobacteria bacterium]